MRLVVDGKLLWRVNLGDVLAQYNWIIGSVDQISGQVECSESISGGAVGPKMRCWVRGRRELWYKRRVDLIERSRCGELIGRAAFW